MARQCHSPTFTVGGLSLWELGQLAKVRAAPWLSHLSRLGRGKKQEPAAKTFAPFCAQQWLKVEILAVQLLFGHQVSN